MNRMTHTLTLAVLAGTLAACSPNVRDLGGFGGSNDEDRVDSPPVSGLGEDWGLEPARLDYFEGLATGAAQRQQLCSMGNSDRLTQWYCQEPAPVITGLEDVLVGLGLKDLANPNAMTFAITGHSSSLVTRKTSVLNPRAIIFTPAGTPDYVALGFVRGDGFAEVAAFDTVKQDINFFLIKFETACGEECSNAERFGPSAEKGWQKVTIYGDQDLKNTVLDCLQCHQPGGLQARRMLRMQELQDPWTHWFRDNRPSVELLDTFLAAHPNEDYAGIPAAIISNSDPADLEDLVRDAGFDVQPNEFQTDAIANEGPRGPTWIAQYEKALAGTDIAVPHFEISPYDPIKVEEATLAYLGVMDGSVAPSAMPDLTQLFKDEYLADLSFTARPDASAKEIVLHRCGTCHNGTFPGISRNNFVAMDFPNIPPEMKAKVLQRVRMPKSSRLRMPPLFFSELEESQIVRIEEALNTP